MIAGGFEAVLEATQQAGQVSTLGPIEGVELIDDDVAQRFWVGLVVLPEGLGIGLDEEVIQHFVVGQQDVGRVAAQGGLIGDDFVWPHLGGGLVVLVADVEASGDLALERWGVVDETGDAFGLVGGQGIHGVDQNSFDAGVADLLAAVL